MTPVQYAAIMSGIHVIIIMLSCVLIVMAVHQFTSK